MIKENSAGSFHILIKLPLKEFRKQFNSFQTLSPDYLMPRGTTIQPSFLYFPSI